MFSEISQNSQENICARVSSFCHRSATLEKHYFLNTFLIVFNTIVWSRFFVIVKGKFFVLWHFKLLIIFCFFCYIATRVYKNRSSRPEVTSKKLFHKISQISQAKTCVAVFFNKVICLYACNFIKKELQYMWFFCGMCEIFKNTCFYRIPRVAASVTWTIKTSINKPIVRKSLQSWRHIKARGRLSFSASLLLPSSF